MTSEVWCVEWRDSEGARQRCALAEQPAEEPEYDDSLATACGYFIILTSGVTKNEPTCPECLHTLL